MGDNMSLTGTLNLAVKDVILSSGSLTLNGGLLEVSEDASISSAVIQEVSSEFSVATGKNSFLHWQFIRYKCLYTGPQRRGQFSERRLVS